MTEPRRPRQRDDPPAGPALRYGFGAGGCVAVEPPRHSHDAHGVARRSLDFVLSYDPRSPSWEGHGMTPDDLRTAVLDLVTEEGRRWLADACTSVARDPSAVRALFPLAGRRCGRDRLGAGADPYGWTVDDAARCLLLVALPTAGAALPAELAELYRTGDAAERRAVLRALPLLDVGDGALPLVRDALRTNDTRLIAAALGDYATDRLDAETYRQGVLKCVFTGIPLTAVPGLPGRADVQLARMMVAFAEERTAAGRDVPADIRPLLALFPQVRVDGRQDLTGHAATATTDRPSPMEA